MEDQAKTQYAAEAPENAATVKDLIRRFAPQIEAEGSAPDAFLRKVEVNMMRAGVYTDSGFLRVGQKLNDEQSRNNRQKAPRKRDPKHRRGLPREG